ncbi:MAG TPA: DUF1540 domain-containing protein [Clostridiales bacterium]|nr:MAG: hypothetical protein A2Y18_06865 [Clostridiales bacterium GWD2_32_19]HCC07974.1 DUF1540 domain-containing protein [Clostridiales bacterium]
MKDNKSIKCSVEECVYNDIDKSFCTLDDINVTSDNDMEFNAICSSFEPSDEETDYEGDDDSDDESNPDDHE